MARSCRFWRLCVATAAGSAGGTTGTEQATLPNTSTLEAGACTGNVDKITYSLTLHIDLTRSTSCSQTNLDVPARKSTDWTIRPVWVLIGCSEAQVGRSVLKERASICFIKREPLIPGFLYIILTNYIEDNCDIKQYFHIVR